MQILITRVMDRTPRPQQTHTLSLNTTSHVSKPVNTRTPTAPPFFQLSSQRSIRPRITTHRSAHPESYLPRGLAERSDGGLTIHVAMLRGINVAGEENFRMEELPGSVWALGFWRGRKDIQSGNVLFEDSKSASGNFSETIAKKNSEGF